MRPILTYAIAALAWTASAWTRPACAGVRQEREAAAILALIVAEDLPVERCQYGTSWDRYPVPSRLARRYLGLNLDADLLAAAEPLSFERALDPRGSTPSAFCSGADNLANVSRNLDAFERDLARWSTVMRSTAITFPVFDASYRTAIVIVTTGEHDGRMRRDGQVRTLRLPWESATNAWIYRKTGNRWRRAGTEWLEVS